MKQKKMGREQTDFKENRFDIDLLSSIFAATWRMAEGGRQKKKEARERKSLRNRTRISKF